MIATPLSALWPHSLRQSKGKRQSQAFPRVASVGKQRTAGSRLQAGSDPAAQALLGRSAMTAARRLKAQDDARKCSKRGTLQRGALLAGTARC